jgi:predicted ester cyclase
MKKSLLQIIMIIPIILLLCFTFSCQQQIEEGITLEEAKAFSDRDLEIWNEGNLAIADELYDPDYVGHSGELEDVVGIDAFKEDVTNVRTDFPDFKFTIEEIFVKDDKIVERWIATGTSVGTTDKKIRVSGVSILHVVNGKFVERWTHYNEATVLRQLGFTFTPPQPPAPQEKE